MKKYLFIYTYRFRAKEFELFSADQFSSDKAALNYAKREFARISSDEYADELVKISVNRRIRKDYLNINKIKK